MLQGCHHALGHRTASESSGSLLSYESGRRSLVVGLHTLGLQWDQLPGFNGINFPTPLPCCPAQSFSAVCHLANTRRGWAGREQVKTEPCCHRVIPQYNTALPCKQLFVVSADQVHSKPDSRSCTFELRPSRGSEIRLSYEPWSNRLLPDFLSQCALTASDGSFASGLQSGGFHNKGAPTILASYKDCQEGHQFLEASFSQPSAVLNFPQLG